ncbi:MAG: hypothetical protein H6Q90_5209, partial [Deltaproteobacteria bacterium]|nr:hypothetical protein [Deltaproteobacteria bacterium]
MVNDQEVGSATRDEHMNGVSGTR